MQLGIYLRVLHLGRSSERDGLSCRLLAMRLGNIQYLAVTAIKILFHIDMGMPTVILSQFTFSEHMYLGGRTTNSNLYFQSSDHGRSKSVIIITHGGHVEERTLIAI